MKRFTAPPAAVIVAMLAIASVRAQDASQQFVGETTVNVVEVPVRVIDPATGEAVTGLDPSEFRILEDGVPQQISNFSEIQSAVTIRTASADATETAPAAETST
jgi:hypothetical protein